MNEGARVPDKRGCEKRNLHECCSSPALATLRPVSCRSPAALPQPTTLPPHTNMPSSSPATAAADERPTASEHPAKRHRTEANDTEATLNTIMAHFTAVEHTPIAIAKLGMVSPCQNLAKEKRRPGSRCSATNNHQQQGLPAQVRTGLPLRRHAHRQGRVHTPVDNRPRRFGGGVEPEGAGG